MGFLFAEYMYITTFMSAFSSSFLYPLANVLTQHFIPHLCAIICQHQQKKRFFLLTQYSVIRSIPWIKMKHFSAVRRRYLIAVKDNKP